MSIYLGTFLIACAMLAMEVTLTRLLSVTSWYHLAFFAIATAMLGMTAGATLVYLRPRHFAPRRLHENAAAACLRFALAVPICLIVLCLLPLTLTANVMGLATMLAATGACLLPFFFAGITITLVLTKCQLPIGVVYASDLAGGSFGCLLVLVGLEFVDAPSLILFCASVGALAAYVFARGNLPARRTRRNLLIFLLLTVVAYVNSTTPRGIRPLFVKERLEPAQRYLLERWNSFSRISVDPASLAAPKYWGPSPRAPQEPVFQYQMAIDGEAGTALGQFQSPEQSEYLRYDVTNVAYYLRPTGRACVIGVGGGRDVQAALLFGREDHTRHVTGIEVNPIFIDLLKGQFREFANLAGREDVDLVVDEARSYMSRSEGKFATVQMSLTDTWAATGAGAYCLSENSLYTLEAWKVFVSRLERGGIFTVSRWYNRADLGETGRLLSLAVATVLETTSGDPSGQIALVTCGPISTLLLSNEPFTEVDIQRLRVVCSELQYGIAVIPGELPENPILREIMAARSLTELRRVRSEGLLRYDPPTDEDPYFFNMLRLRHLWLPEQMQMGVIRGNLTATFTLVGLIYSLAIAAMGTVLVPLILGSRSGQRRASAEPLVWAGALYFSLIGVGFMLVEIALIQKLSVLLSHPIYAMGILLFTMILSAGTGSLLSETLPLNRAPWVFVYPPAAAGTVLGVHVLLSFVLENMITSPMWSRILASIAVIFPVGMILGLFFPAGMRLVRAIRPGETPWYWALNGVFGVLASALAVLFSMFVGISTNLYIAAACYALTLVCVAALYRRRPVPTAMPSVT